MKKIAILFAVLVSLHVVVSAQKRSSDKKNDKASSQQMPSNDLNRELEVTRAYEPTLNEANKLTVKPNMLDTVQLRPEYEYGITPRPINYGFEVAPIRVASINVDLLRSRNPLYVKVAAGYPFQTIGDIYFNTTNWTRGRIGAYLNHQGSWSKIKNGNEVKTPASATFNTVGVVGERNWEDYTLDGEVKFGYDGVTRYGFTDRFGTQSLVMDTTASALRQHYARIDARVGFGNRFEDLSRFYFHVGANGGYFMDKFDNAATNFAAAVDLGKRFASRHDVRLRVAYEGVEGQRELSTYSNNQVSLTPQYELKAGRFDFRLGLNYTYDNDKSRGATNHFFPLFRLQYSAPNGYFTPYIAIDGKLTRNDYVSLTRENPYIMAGFTAPNTVEYNGRIGVTGSFSSAFSYHVFGGISRMDNLVTYANFFGNLVQQVSKGNMLTVLNDSVNMWTVGADLQGRISGAFGLEASVLYKGFSKKLGDYVSGIPNLTARLDLRYSVRDKLILTLGATILTERYFLLEGGGSVLHNGVQELYVDKIDYERVGATVDLHFGAEYRFSDSLSVFLNANNLANQKLYPFYLYRALGINALAGVKLAF